MFFFFFQQAQQSTFQIENKSKRALHSELMSHFTHNKLLCNSNDDDDDVNNNDDDDEDNDVEINTYNTLFICWFLFC